MLEEMYVYFNMPAPAFGIQLVYNQTEYPELVTVVREGDAVLRPSGYHPNVAVPGHPICFLWAMAAHREGEDRSLVWSTCSEDSTRRLPDLNLVGKTSRCPLIKSSDLPSLAGQLGSINSPSTSPRCSPIANRRPGSAEGDDQRQIVNIASVLSFEGRVLVRAAKGGAAQLTKVLANESALKGSKVKAIASGYLAIDNTAALRRDRHAAARSWNGFLGAVLGRALRHLAALLFSCALLPMIMFTHVVVNGPGRVGNQKIVVAPLPTHPSAIWS
jgi:hypothetical protein